MSFIPSMMHYAVSKFKFIEPHLSTITLLRLNSGGSALTRRWRKRKLNFNSRSGWLSINQGLVCNINFIFGLKVRARKLLGMFALIWEVQHWQVCAILHLTLLLILSNYTSRRRAQRGISFLRKESSSWRCVPNWDNRTVTQSMSPCAISLSR